MRDQLLIVNLGVALSMGSTNITFLAVFFHKEKLKYNQNFNLTW